MNNFVPSVNVLLSEQNGDWLARFQARNSRIPRVLHVGNIANNAYNCAKILNEAGLENDVICYDYYHIMGCPEWEDGDFEGDFGDQFRPDWSKADVRGFQRQHWFAQGPMVACIDYLMARRNGDVELASRLWEELCAENGALATSDAIETRRFPRAAESNVTRRRRVTRRRLLRKIKSIVSIIVDGQGISSRITRVVDHGELAGLTKSETFKMIFSLLALGASVVLRVIALALRPALRLRFRFQLRPTGFRRVRKPDFCFDRQVRAMVARFAQEFPNRNDHLREEDLEPYRYVVDLWRPLLAQYDYVLFYATTPVFALASGATPFFALEHGTLRSIPFDPDSQGRCTALGYRLAQHAFVTNFDCRDSAQELCGEGFTLINHPYDEDHGLRIAGADELRSKLLTELDADLLFFFPTRHDWVAGSGYADKANDLFIRAFAELRRTGIRPGMVCCDWGKNVEDSRNLALSLDVEAHIRWIRPQAIVPFERMAKAADCVVDQFKLGAFGGIVFKAMAVGAPVLTYLDEARLLMQYDEFPPVINCASEAQIVDAVTALATAPDGFKVLGERSRAWVKRHHGKRATVNAIVDQFRKSPPMGAIAANT